MGEWLFLALFVTRVVPDQLLLVWIETWLVFPRVHRLLRLLDFISTVASGKESWDILQVPQVLFFSFFLSSEKPLVFVLFCFTSYVKGSILRQRITLAAPQGKAENSSLFFPITSCKLVGSSAGPWGSHTQQPGPRETVTKSSGMRCKLTVSQKLQWDT